MPRGLSLHVRASIGGQVGTFLLDSGASAVIVYRPYADKLKMTTLGRTGFRGVNGGGVAARFMRLNDPIVVGKNSLSNLIVISADGEFAAGIDGILGYDFLAGGLIDVDTANQTIRILDPSTREPAVGPGAYAFTVNLASRQPEIAIKASGVPTRAIFDTGASVLAVLSDDLQSSGRLVSLNDTINIGGVAVEYQIPFYGVDGPAQFPAKCSRLGQLDVGPYKYQNVETCFALGSVFGRDGGLIGFDFLKHFNWTFDYPESKFVLTPNGK
jgi:predicted aspartyl protease